MAQQITFTPYHEKYILPGFVLVDRDNPDHDSVEIIKYSCWFCNIPEPELSTYTDKSIIGNKFTSIKIQGKFISSAEWISQRDPKRSLFQKTHHVLKNNCFTIKIKPEKELKRMIGLSDVLEIQEKQNEYIHKNNVGRKLLQGMGWNGKGLGKYEQGELEPIKTYMYPKHLGFGNEVDGNCIEKIIMGEKMENDRIRKLLLDFIESTNQILSFSTEFTSADRDIIYWISCENDLRTESYGEEDQRYIEVIKKPNVKKIINELIHCGYENKYYKLIPPNNTNTIYEALQKNEDARPIPCIEPIPRKKKKYTTQPHTTQALHVIVENQHDSWQSNQNYRQFPSSGYLTTDENDKQ